MLGFQPSSFDAVQEAVTTLHLGSCEDSEESRMEYWIVHLKAVMSWVCVAAGNLALSVIDCNEVLDGMGDISRSVMAERVTRFFNEAWGCDPGLLLEAWGAGADRYAGSFGTHAPQL